MALENAKKYAGKAKLVLQNPSKIRYLPNFLKQEFTLWRGKKKAKIGDVTCTFVVNSLTEYERINGFKDEEEIIKEIMSEIEEGDVFYDIGANIGTHSCFIGKSGARVYGFEPFPKNIESLEQNFRLNSLRGDTFRIALMNENSEMSLEEKSGKAGEGKVTVGNKGKIKTKVSKGDKIIDDKGLEKPNIVKIDVEGAELEVIKGLEEILESKELRKIFIELHPKRIEEFGGSTEELRNLLKQKGFEIEKISDRNKETHIKAIST